MKNHINNIYDVIIIGGGPCGLSASLYLKRANLKILIIEKQNIGGKVFFTDEIENYLIGKTIKGMELAENMSKQISSLGIETMFNEVINIKKNVENFEIFLKNNKSLLSKTILICSGTKENELKALNSEKFKNKGISYCAICDGKFFENKDVCIVGGGYAAFEEGMFLASLVKKLYLIHRREEFRVTENIVDKFKKLKNTKIITNSIIEEVNGEKKVEKIILKNTVTNKKSSLKIDGIFPYIGQFPVSNFIENINIKTKDGFIIVDDNFSTNINGIYAGGDVINKKIRQIATAVSDGCNAALNIVNYLQNL